MRKSFTVLLVLCLAAGAFAGEARKKEARVDRTKHLTRALVAEGLVQPARKHDVFRSSAIGPGVKLIDSQYDYGSNGGAKTNLVDYGDGTLAVGRMAATQGPPATSPDRGSYFSYFDGANWSPMTKVEQLRRGWSSIGTMADGRSVIVSHVAQEVNVDALKGFGIWTSTITGGASAAAPQWPVMTVDGDDNIIICSTTNATVNGVALVKQIHRSTDDGTTWSNFFIFPDTSTRKPGFNADDQAIDSWQNKVAVAVSEFADDIHLWESTDNGATWTYTNVTNYPRDIPVGEIQSRPYVACDVVYDNDGNVHILWEGLLATQDTLGTAIDLFFDRSVGIHHWSAATGITQVVAWEHIPDSNTETDDELFAVAGPDDATQSQITLTGHPQGGFDAAGNFYVLFAAIRPKDVDPSGYHYTDLYAVGSRDNGARWGFPTNVTNTAQSEDMWASLADNIGDSLRFVYQSDGSTGSGLQGRGTAPTAILYYAVHKNIVNLDPRPVSVTDRPNGVPASYALAQNFPNPFNPSTSISFSLPASVNVKLEVYNMIGQKVATLVEGKLASGDHTVNWNAQDVPSGIYFYKLEAADFSQTRKLVLMK